MDAPDQVEMLARIFLGVALGALIGFEREYRGFEAGTRTTSLVAGGAAAFGVASLQLGDSRVAAGVVQGIGFLGPASSSRPTPR